MGSWGRGRGGIPTRGRGRGGIPTPRGFQLLAAVWLGIVVRMLPRKLNNSCPLLICLTLTTIIYYMHWSSVVFFPLFINKALGLASFSSPRQGGCLRQGGAVGLSLSYVQRSGTPWAAIPAQSEGWKGAGQGGQGGPGPTGEG